MTPIKITVQALSYAVETAEAIEQAASGLAKLLVCRVEFEEGFYLTWNPDSRIWEVEIPDTARPLVADSPSQQVHDTDTRCRALNPDGRDSCWYRVGHDGGPPDIHSWSPEAPTLERERAVV